MFGFEPVEPRIHSNRVLRPSNRVIFEPSPGFDPALARVDLPEATQGRPHVLRPVYNVGRRYNKDRATGRYADEIFGLFAARPDRVNVHCRRSQM